MEEDVKVYELSLTEAEIKMLQALIKTAPIAMKGNLEQLSKLVKDLRALDEKLMEALGNPTLPSPKGEGKKRGDDLEENN